MIGWKNITSDWKAYLSQDMPLIFASYTRYIHAQTPPFPTYPVLPFDRSLLCTTKPRPIPDTITFYNPKVGPTSDLYARIQFSASNKSCRQISDTRQSYFTAVFFFKNNVSKMALLANRLNHTNGMIVVTPTDGPKSIRNRCVIEIFDGFWCCHVAFFIFLWVGGFCHRIE